MEVLDYLPLVIFIGNWFQ